TLSEAEQQLFDQLLLDDMAFAEEITFRKAVQQVIRQEERAKIKDQLRSFEQEKKVSSHPANLRKWLSVAAAILLIGMVSLWWYSSRYSAAGLYEEYYETFPNIVQPLVRGNKTVERRSQAFEAYDKGEYRKAAQLFAEATDINNQFYHALSEMELGEHKKASAIFEGMDVSNTDLKPFILWYKALNLVKLDRKKEAKEILSELEKDVDFNSWERVKELRKELE
ncbi:MAG TPA: hypothetical protein PKA53_06545, partial [Sphingobacterium sp.]|nr:hypothetical protein [Sphingobacterium sp.]